MNQRDSQLLVSSAFGPFDPLAPALAAGVFARNLVAPAIDIRAPVELVWQVMTDFDDYPQWNPLNRFFRLDGRAEPGHSVTFGPCWGPYHADGALPEADMTTRETITVWERNRCLAYGDLRRLFKAERAQYLQPLADGRTRYHTFERICGPLAPLVRLVFGQRIIRGFTANGVALKVRAESMAARP